MRFARLLVMFALPGLLWAKEPKEKTPAKPKDETVALDDYNVRGSAVSSFAISFRVFHNAEQKRTRILIFEVAENSDAERLGLQAGNEIVKINGSPVRNMDPRVTKETELGKLFLNRSAGALLELDLALDTGGTHRVTLRAIK